MLGQLQLHISFGPAFLPVAVYPTGQKGQMFEDYCGILLIAKYWKYHGCFLCTTMERTLALVQTKHGAEQYWCVLLL
jgi:hypothetical protein